MKKVYINDLDTTRRNGIIKLNTKLMQMLQTELYQHNMFLQEEEGREMFGADSYRYIDIRDHYTSFYLVLKDWRKFIDNLDKNYLSPKATTLYNEIIKDIKKLDEIDEDSEKYNMCCDWIELDCKKLLKCCEEQLHIYEEYPSENEAIIYADEMEQLEDYYIEEREDGTTDNVIRKDIAYTETYL